MERVSVRVAPLNSIKELTQGRSPINAQYVERASVRAPKLKNIKKFIQGKSLINAQCVERVSLRAPTLNAIKQFIQERSSQIKQRRHRKEAGLFSAHRNICGLEIFYMGRYEIPGR